MRRFLFIFVAALAYLALSSRSCGGPDEDDAVSGEIELSKVQIIDEFEVDVLSGYTLHAFEAKAGQKLVDLADYLGIYCDHSLDTSFKAQTRQMIQDLFISDTVCINSFLAQAKGSTILTLTEWLDACPDKNYLSADFLFDSIEVVNPLHRIGPFDYHGTLKFSRLITTCSYSDTAVSERSVMQVEMAVSKVSKSFGADTLQVWGVFLGNIW